MSGGSWPVSSCPFLGVEGLFNEANFWICMDGATVHQDPDALTRSFAIDLADSSRWQPLFMPPSKMKQVCHRWAVRMMLRQCRQTARLENACRWMPIRKP